MSKFINVREQIILRNAWVLTREEKEKLDHFFLIIETWNSLAPDFYIDEQECKRFLRHEGKEYEVLLLNPVRQLAAAKNIGLSFRVHKATDIRVVLIKEWYEVNGTKPEGESQNG